mmetsp:Transcript_117635/g.305265  ORF Transcript_117635/g.305265 Transcript_117635/m.305265 type:complete len:215 (-) Transcript_117635:376-1020(-)
MDNLVVVTSRPPMFTMLSSLPAHVISCMILPIPNFILRATLRVARSAPKSAIRSSNLPSMRLRTHRPEKSGTDDAPPSEVCAAGASSASGSGGDAGAASDGRSAAAGERCLAASSCPVGRRVKMRRTTFPLEVLPSTTMLPSIRRRTPVGNFFPSGLLMRTRSAESSQRAMTSIGAPSGPPVRCGGAPTRNAVVAGQRPPWWTIVKSSPDCSMS